MLVAVGRGGRITEDAIARGPRMGPREPRALRDPRRQPVAGRRRGSAARSRAGSTGSPRRPSGRAWFSSRPRGNSGCTETAPIAAARDGALGHRGRRLRRPQRPGAQAPRRLLLEFRPDRRRARQARDHRAGDVGRGADSAGHRRPTHGRRRCRVSRGRRTTGCVARRRRDRTRDAGPSGRRRRAELDAPRDWIDERLRDGEDRGGALPARRRHLVRGADRGVGRGADAGGEPGAHAGRRSSASCSRRPSRVGRAARAIRQGYGVLNPARGGGGGAAREPRGRPAASAPRSRGAGSCFAFHDDAAARVELAGDFNGWDASRCPLARGRREETGSWSSAPAAGPLPATSSGSTVSAGSPTRPNPVREPDPYGGLNSVLSCSPARRCRRRCAARRTTGASSVRSACRARWRRTLTAVGVV